MEFFRVEFHSLWKVWWESIHLDVAPLRHNIQDRTRKHDFIRSGMSGKYAFMAARSHEATMETFTCSLTNKGQKDTKPSFERIDFSPSDGAEEEARSEADAVQRGRFWVGWRMAGSCCLLCFFLPNVGSSAWAMQICPLCNQAAWMCSQEPWIAKVAQPKQATCR